MTKAEYLGRFGYSLADVATLCVGDFKWHRQNSNARFDAIFMVGCNRPSFVLKACKKKNLIYN